MDIKITPNIWSDPKLEDVTPEARLAVFWLLTNPRVNMVGFAEIGIKRFIFETGLTPEALEQAFEALPKGFVRNGSSYWIRGFIAHQLGRGSALVRNNYCKPLVRDLKGLGRAWVIDAVLDEYPELLEPLQAGGLAEGSPEETKHQRREEKRREEQNSTEKLREEPRARTNRPSDVDEVVAYFAAKGAPRPEAEMFFDHYEANGWKQGGRASIRSWQSAANNWIRRWRGGAAGGKNIVGGGARGPVVHFDPSLPNAHTGGLADAAQE